MSWLFGLRNNPPQQPPEAGGNVPVGNAPPPGGGSTGQGDPKISKAMEAYRFDSAALERAAQAAKELERSCKLSSLDIGLTFMLLDLS